MNHHSHCHHSPNSHQSHNNNHHSHKKARHSISLVLILSCSLLVSLTYNVAHFSPWTCRQDYESLRKAVGSSNRNNIHNHQSEGSALPTIYEPSKMEAYAMRHAEKLQYNLINQTKPTCSIWTNPKTSQSIYGHLQLYRKQLKEYEQRVEKFSGAVKDLREHMKDDTNNNNNGGGDDDPKSICDSLHLHPQGLEGIFDPKYLSKIPHGHGYAEPLMVPFRHPEFCYDPQGNKINMGYLIHDFASLCRHRLHKHSRTVFVDMGAALDFHSAYKYNKIPPAIYITHMYQKFGFHFDHIYAYEINQKDPKAVFRAIPEDLKAAYHWYNVGVDASIESIHNPLKMIKENFREQDFVVVKLDIDTSWVELPMVQLLLQDETLLKLVDAFYFEHHVNMYDMKNFWKEATEGTVQESLNIFTALREKGVASHYWP
jgi:hypothetical protein